MAYITLVAGFALLLVCGDLLVRGASSLAVHLGIPALIVGLTVVAFGTSAPELVISLRAALSGSPGIAVGNVVGSNIANVFLVLGLPAIICTTDCNQPFVTRNTLYMIGASLLFIAFLFTGQLSFWHGAVLFALLVLFLIESGRRAARRRKSAKVLGEEALEMIDGVSGLPHSPWIVAAYIATGIIGLPLGAHLTVDAAVDIATAFGVSKTSIGLTVIALGTSLPELATTMSAALRRQCGLALGNVLGSNLFNILGIMGVTAMITPVPVPEQILRIDVWVMLAAALAITPFVLRKTTLTRVPATLFVLAYVAYIAFVFMPQGGAKLAMF